MFVVEAETKASIKIWFDLTRFCNTGTAGFVCSFGRWLEG